MDLREERLARNEMLFRKANDRIDARADDDDVIEFFCECSDRDCAERIPVTAHEFETVRTRPTQFLVVPGHEVPDIERVIVRTPVYLVVEKVGEAAQFVREELG